VLGKKSWLGRRFRLVETGGGTVDDHSVVEAKNRPAAEGGAEPWTHGVHKTGQGAAQHRCAEAQRVHAMFGVRLADGRGVLDK